MPLSKLNSEQYAAATAPLGHNLIIASAGTGKTSTIVGRIAYLLQNGASADKILLLTFTNKAAKEMIERVSKFFGADVAKQIMSGTFHAVSYKYLKEKTGALLKQPKDLKTLLKSIYERRTFDIDPKNTPYSYQHIFDSYSLFLNSGTQTSFAEFLSAKNPAQMQYANIYEDIVSEFSTAKKEHHYVDYNDLLIEFRNAMSQSPLDFYEVLCDEYQDTNPLQESILSALRPKSLFCVGDYDQSIYAFNGADISIISSFADKYADSKVFSLSKNYRSSAQILNLANKLIEQNPRIYPKRLEVGKVGEFGTPKLKIYDDLFDQYSAIAKMIMLTNHTHSDIAVIFRNNSSADGIEAKLRECGIPCRRKGSASFFDSKEINLILDILSIAANSRDMMAYINVLSYGDSIGAAMSKDIFDCLLRLGSGDAVRGFFSPNSEIRAYEQKAKNTGLGLFDDFFALQDRARFDEFLDSEFKSHPVLEHPKLHKNGAIFLNNFYVMLKSARRYKEPKAVVSCIVESDFFKHIAQNLARTRAKNKNGEIDEKRLENASEAIKSRVATMKMLCADYDNVQKLLNAMVLGSNEVSEGSGVNLLTIHASKGLEFRDVYVVDLMEGRFPNTSLMKKSGSLEEERRLLYVAITRAKENLVLSYAQRDKAKNANYVPSCFLYEMGLVSKSE